MTGVIFFTVSISLPVVFYQLMGPSTEFSNYLERVALTIIDLFVVLEFTKATFEFSQPKPSPSESKPKVSGANTVKFL